MTTTSKKRRSRRKRGGRSQRGSLFQPAVVRAAVCTFFFGAVVPLVIMGAIIENSALTMIGASVSIADPTQRALLFSFVAFLALLSFLNLRRLFVRAIGENQELAFFGRP